MLAAVGLCAAVISIDTVALLGVLSWTQDPAEARVLALRLGLVIALAGIGAGERPYSPASSARRAQVVLATVMRALWARCSCWWLFARCGRLALPDDPFERRGPMTDSRPPRAMRPGRSSRRCRRGSHPAALPRRATPTRRGAAFARRR